MKVKISFIDPAATITETIEWPDEIPLPNIGRTERQIDGHAEDILESGQIFHKGKFWVVTQISRQHIVENGKIRLGVHAMNAKSYF